MSDIRKVSGVRVISRIDPAIDWDVTTEDEWARYMKDCQRNEDAVKFKGDEQATIFLCNFDFDGKEAAIIKNHMIGGSDKFSESKKDTKMTMGSWAYMVTKYALKEIQNPAGTKDGLELKKSGNYVSDDFMSSLTNLGVVEEIFVHYMALTQKDKTSGNLKN
jgi:hypothetical protein